MKIRTKCKDCAYLRTGNKCLYGFDAYSEDNEIYVDSFCRFKRQDPISNEELVDEDKDICMVLNCFGRDEGYILKHLSDEVKDCPFVSEWIIAANCSYNSQTIKKIQEIFINKKCSWRLRIFVNEEYFNFDKYMIENESIKERINANWYSYNDIGCPYNKDLYMSFVRALNEQKNFLEIRSGDAFIRNFFAFVEVGGNFNGLFVDKIKAYENHEEAVISL